MAAPQFPNEPGSPRRAGLTRALGTTAVVALVSGGLVVASAAGLGGVTAVDLGAGTASVASCDADGFDYSYTVSVGAVTAIVVGGIADPGCEGGTLEVTLAGGDGTALASGSAVLTADGDILANTATVTLGAQPLLTDVARVHAVVRGP